MGWHRTPWSHVIAIVQLILLVSLYSRAHRGRVWKLAHKFPTQTRLPEDRTNSVPTLSLTTHRESSLTQQLLLVSALNDSSWHEWVFPRLQLEAPVCMHITVRKGHALYLLICLSSLLVFAWVTVDMSTGWFKKFIWGPDTSPADNFNRLSSEIS